MPKHPMFEPWKPNVYFEFAAFLEIKMAMMLVKKPATSYLID